MLRRLSSLYGFVGVALVTVAVIGSGVAGCSSSSGGRRGTGGASGATANAGSGNNAGGSGNGSDADGGLNGGVNPGGGGSNTGGSTGGSMDDLANQVKRPAVDTETPAGVPTSMDATQAGTGDLIANTAQAGDSGDSVWLSMEDIDGDGVEEDVYTLIDDETGDKYVWYDTVIPAFCNNGDDSNATVVLSYIAEEDSWTMIWDSDCAEDEGLIYACALNNVTGVPEDCGVCGVDANGQLQCLNAGDPGTGEADAGAGAGGAGGSSGAGGGGSGGAGGAGGTPPTVGDPYVCQCLADCDGVVFESDPGGYCADSLEEATATADDDCYASFTPADCFQVFCSCACEPTTEYSCEATAF